MWGRPAFQQGLHAWDPTSRHVCSSCCQPPPPLPCSRSVGVSGFVGSHAGKRLLCHAGSRGAPALWLGSSSQIKESHTRLLKRVCKLPWMSGAARTPVSLCALLRHLGVCVRGFGPHSSHSRAFIPFTDATLSIRR